MAKAWVHAVSSAKRFGGVPEDYLSIHNHLDATKSSFSDNRHRAITHNAWYIGPDGPLERIFGAAMTNSDGRRIPVRSVAEQHVQEDFHGIIPTLQDFLGAMEPQAWMNGLGDPPSRRGAAVRYPAQPEAHPASETQTSAVPAEAGMAHLPVHHGHGTTSSHETDVRGGHTTSHTDAD